MLQSLDSKWFLVETTTIGQKEKDTKAAPKFPAYIVAYLCEPCAVLIRWKANSNLSYSLLNQYRTELSSRFVLANSYRTLVGYACVYVCAAGIIVWGILSIVVNHSFVLYAFGNQTSTDCHDLSKGWSSQCVFMRKMSNDLIIFDMSVFHLHFLWKGTIEIGY